jgi:hypothetical protein
MQNSASVGNLTQQQSGGIGPSNEDAAHDQQLSERRSFSKFGCELIEFLQFIG